MRAWSVSAFFVTVMAFGMWLNDRSWNGQVFVYVGEQRSPAAIRTLSDYSSLDHHALYRSVHSQLLASAEVFKRDGQFGVQLGHPLVDRKGGGKEFGCQVQDHSGLFDRMEMVFVGVGVSEDGEAPRMTIDSGCRAQSDLNKLETVWIPMNEIIASRAKDQLYQGENPVSVRLEYIPTDHWPDSWVLWSVKLYHDGNPDESLLIDSSLLKAARPKLLSLDMGSSK